MRPLFFLVYINDLAEKPFADDTSLHSVVSDLNTCANEVNDNLKKIETWVHQLKVSFNLDPLKQVEDVIFSRKENKPPSSWYNFQRQSGKKKALNKNIWVCFLIVNLILMNILKDYLIKPANLLVIFASSNIFYQEHLFFRSINLLVDLT